MGEPQSQTDGTALPPPEKIDSLVDSLKVLIKFIKCYNKAKEELIKAGFDEELAGDLAAGDCMAAIGLDTVKKAMSWEP